MAGQLFGTIVAIIVTNAKLFAIGRRNFSDIRIKCKDLTVDDGCK